MHAPVDQLRGEIYTTVATVMRGVGQSPTLEKGIACQPRLHRKRSVYPAVSVAKAHCSATRGWRPPTHCFRSIPLALRWRRTGRDNTSPCRVPPIGTAAVRPTPSARPFATRIVAKLLKKYEERCHFLVRDTRENRPRANSSVIVGIELERIVPDGSRMAVLAVHQRVPTKKALAADPDLRKTWAPVMLLLSALRDCLHTHFQTPPEKAVQIAMTRLT